MEHQLEHDTHSNCQEDEEDYEPIPLADQLMKRGEFLRQLRQMELADQMEREQTRKVEAVNEQLEKDVIDTLPNGKRVLRYDSYLAHQRYYDDLKHVDCCYIDYGIIIIRESGRLVIEQDKSLGKGGLCWDAAHILAEHLIENKDEWNTTFSDHTTLIVELGTGTGLCGLMIAKAVADCHVRITDLPELLPLMKRNVTRNFHSNRIINEVENGNEYDSSIGDEEFIQELLFATKQDESAPRAETTTPTSTAIVHARNSRGTVSANVLRWGEHRDYRHAYDVVLGADVVASLYDPIALAETMHDLCHDTSIVYVSYKGRLTGPHEQFEERLKSLFEKVERIRPNSRNKNPQVWILKATGKIK